MGRTTMGRTTMEEQSWEKQPWEEQPWEEQTWEEQEFKKKNQCQMSSDRRIYSRTMVYKVFIDKEIQSR
jgi:hypothetical protein